MKEPIKNWKCKKQKFFWEGCMISPRFVLECLHIVGILGIDHHWVLLLFTFVLFFFFLKYHLPIKTSALLINIERRPQYARVTLEND
jgi:hypothetical protein